MGIDVELVEDLASWRPFAASWDELTRNVPFRSFAWLSTWWEHYGPGNSQQEWPRLFVLVVRDADGMPIGFAPWMLSSSLRTGRVLTMLGTGEVYSDYLSILARQGNELQVADMLAQWLCGPGEKLWDIIDLTGVDYEDRTANLLVGALQYRSLSTHRRQGLATWRLKLPPTWDDYLAQLSKSHRKKIRRLERGLLKPGQITVHQVERPDQLWPAFELFVDLHQRRWRSLAKPGCFSSPRFAGFLADATPRLFAAGQLRLLWLEHRGRPLAADYMLVGDDVLYSYQGGIEPERLDLQPGRVALIAALQGAIAGGYRCYDFLRGNEPYKAHYGAEARPTAAIRIVSPRITAQLRNHAWQVSEDAKLWIKQKLLGRPTDVDLLETPQTV